MEGLRFVIVALPGLFFYLLFFFKLDHASGGAVGLGQKKQLYRQRP